MNLTHRDKEDLIKSFPPIELSYERNTHKKVYCSNIYLTIPKGNKFFAWFTNFKNQSLCFFFQLDRFKKRIQNIFVYNCSFDYALTCGKGTIMYGTIFHIGEARFFNIENLFYYKGNNLSNENQYSRLTRMKQIFQQDIRQKAYTTNDIIFGLPIIDKNRQKLDKLIDNLPYDLYCIQHRMIFRNSPFLNETINIKKNIKATFLVKANIQTDIYDLFCLDGKTLIFHNNACVNDYKTSVLMNSIFRKIKENEDLDKLEESDDEEEFENIRDDKYVNLDKEVKMYFTYSHRFQLWVPINIDDTNDVTQINDIRRVEK